MRTRILVILALIFNGQHLLSQPPLVQFMDNLSFFNPAAVAYKQDDFLSFTSFYRNQWIGLEGNPQNIGSTADFNLSKINSGIGLNFSNERFVWINQFDVGFSYRYSVKFKKQRALSIGVSMNYLNMRNVYLFGEPTLNEEEVSAFSITGRAGLLYSSRKMLLGFSVFHPTEPSLRGLPDSISFRLGRVFNLHGSYKFDINENHALTPELVVFSDLGSNLFMFNLQWALKDRVFVGVGSKNIPVLETRFLPNVSFGYKLFGKLYLGAAYEHYIDLFWGFNSSVEFMIRYDIPEVWRIKSQEEFGPVFD